MYFANKLAFYKLLSFSCSGFINYRIQQKIMYYRVQYSVEHSTTIYTDR